MVIGVRVCVGFGMSNPYPNPRQTRVITLGFVIPMTIPNIVMVMVSQELCHN
jgi:hypothetical protein